MKGIVFIQFTDMVEEKWGEDALEELIERADLDSGGAYTSVGTYRYHEMVSLITHLSEMSGIGGEELQKTFGAYLFTRLGAKYSGFLEGKPDLFSFLESIEDTIHVEVKKLYPEAELPSFEHQRPQSNMLEMLYRSKRPFAALAEGLLRGAIAHFGEEVDLVRKDYEVSTGSKALFTLTKKVN